jgi:hypothetical protein
MCNALIIKTGHSSCEQGLIPMTVYIIFNESQIKVVYKMCTGNFTLWFYRVNVPFNRKKMRVNFQIINFSLRQSQFNSDVTTIVFSNWTCLLFLSCWCIYRFASADCYLIKISFIHKSSHPLLA